MDWDILVHLLKKIAPAVHYHLVYYYVFMPDELYVLIICLFKKNNQ